MDTLWHKCGLDKNAPPLAFRGQVIPLQNGDSVNLDHIGSSFIELYRRMAKKITSPLVQGASRVSIGWLVAILARMAYYRHDEQLQIFQAHSELAAEFGRTVSHLCRPFYVSSRSSAHSF